MATATGICDSPDKRPNSRKAEILLKPKRKLPEKHTPGIPPRASPAAVLRERRRREEHHGGRRGESPVPAHARPGPLGPGG